MGDRDSLVQRQVKYEQSSTMQVATGTRRTPLSRDYDEGGQLLQPKMMMTLAELLDSVSADCYQQMTSIQGGPKRKPLIATYKP